MANQNEYNICKNWGLRCFQQKETSNAVILKCSMNHKDKKTGEYTAPVYIDVVCMFETCEIQQDDYVNSYINVDGHFSTGEYQQKETGKKIPTMSIFADKVTKSVR